MVRISDDVLLKQEISSSTALSEIYTTYIFNSKNVLFSMHIIILITFTFYFNYKHFNNSLFLNPLYNQNDQH